MLGEAVPENLYPNSPKTVQEAQQRIIETYQKTIELWQNLGQEDFQKKLVLVDEMLKCFEKWGQWKNLAVHYVWEDLWWKRKHESISWLEKLIRL